MNTCLPLSRGRGRPCRSGSAMARDEILERAFAAFARDGYDAVSLRQLAKDCAVSDSLLTHHFGSKQELWFEATDSVFAPLLNRLITTLKSIEADSDNPTQNVAQILRRNLNASLTLMACEPAAIAFMFREGEGETERATHLRQHYLQPYLQLIGDLVAQAQAQKLVRAIPHATTSCMILGLMRMLAIPGVYHYELATRLETPEKISIFVNDAVSVFYDGLLLNQP